jgi:hypothetical protein
MTETRVPKIGNLLHWLTWAYEDRVQGVWGSTFWDLLFYDGAVLVLRNPKTLGMKWAAWVSDRARNRWIDAQRFRVEQLARSSPAKLLSRDPTNRLIVNDAVREARLVASIGDCQLVLRLMDGGNVSVFWLHGDGLGGVVSPNAAFDETESVLTEIFGKRFESSEGIGRGQLPSSGYPPTTPPPSAPPPPPPPAPPALSPSPPLPPSRPSPLMSRPRQPLTGSHRLFPQPPPPRSA